MAITRYISDGVAPAPPLAVGRMAVHADELKEGTKGKAVHILHTFGDSLWDMGSRIEPPEVISVDPPQPGQIGDVPETEAAGESSSIECGKGEGPSTAVAGIPTQVDVLPVEAVKFTPQGSPGHILLYPTLPTLIFRGNGIPPHQHYPGDPLPAFEAPSFRIPYSMLDVVFHIHTPISSIILSSRSDPG